MSSTIEIVVVCVDRIDNPKGTVFHSFGHFKVPKHLCIRSCLICDQDEPTAESRIPDLGKIPTPTLKRHALQCYPDNDDSQAVEYMAMQAASQFMAFVMGMLKLVNCDIKPVPALQHVKTSLAAPGPSLQYTELGSNLGSAPLGSHLMKTHRQLVEIRSKKRKLDPTLDKEAYGKVLGQATLHDMPERLVWTVKAN